MILSQVMALLNKQCFDFPSLIFNQNYFGKLSYSLNCYNLAQNHPNFKSWGCFGNLRTFSWWWAQRFLKLMHPRLSNSWKTIIFRDHPFFDSPCRWTKHLNVFFFEAAVCFSFSSLCLLVNFSDQKFWLNIYVNL